MRKSLFLTLVLSLCVADFGAFAANQRGTRNTGNQPGANTPNTQQTAVAARAGNRQQVKSTVQSTSGNVSARAGNKQQVKQPGVQAARAGATQKVINTGTKVATATQNTAVPQECQDAFYGCMDAFCMLDNASGGRCQCSDRITELDAVLEDILKLDEQSYIMATEGVERIQMGEAEEAIMARAKEVAEKSVSDKSDENKKKARTLDLSVFDNNIFSDLDDDLFDAQSAQNSLLDKKGNALFNETTKMCSAQIPAQCKTYGSMLTLVYAQKIKSDCIAYENSLKAQKNQSQQKLQTAQKALRDAALDEYKNQNKYATTGECAIAFTQCMKTTAECGDDYTGCVTLAAAENVKNNKAGSKAKQTKIKGSVSGADITLAASTMEQLLAKKEICASVTRQCVNSNRNDAVWNVFLRNAAPALKSAELIAEQNLRSNCIPTVAKCFSDACKAQFGDNDENYDMCLSNPQTYKSLCKVQLEPCLEATGGTFDKATDSSLWNGLVAMLNSMKVDACTKEVKTCLTERCGEDFSGCIGLDTNSIGGLCPYQKLTACMEADEKGKYKDKDDIRDYVAQIAKGLSVQIDNALATACQNAANEAMIKVCGDTESCDNATFDLSSLESNMKVEVCPRSGACVSSLAMIDNDDLLDRSKGYHAKLQNVPDVSDITFSRQETNNGDHGSLKFGTGNQLLERELVTRQRSLSKFLSPTAQTVDIMQEALDRIMNQINSDPKVVYCREGRQVQGFKTDLGDREAPRFANLTDDKETIVAYALLSKLSAKNAELVSKFNEQIAELDKEITERIYANDEKGVDDQNKKTCEGKATTDANRCKSGDGGNCKCGSTQRTARAGVAELIEKRASYNAETNVCTVETVKYNCVEKFTALFCFWSCKTFDNGTVIDTQNIQMAKSH